MRFTTGYLLVAIIVEGLVLSGCSENTKEHEEARITLLKFTNDFADTLETVKDKESAKASSDRLNEIADDYEKFVIKLNSLPGISVSAQKSLKKKYGAQQKKAQARLDKVGPVAGLASGGEESFMKAL